MTQGEDHDLRSSLSALSWQNWLLLAVAMSAIGCLLAVAGVLIHHYYVVYYAGGVVTADASHFFFTPLLEQVAGLFLLSLTTNLCGALALMAFFAVRKRVRRA